MEAEGKASIENRQMLKRGTSSLGIGKWFTDKGMGAQQRAATLAISPCHALPGTRLMLDWLVG